MAEIVRAAVCGDEAVLAAIDALVNPSPWSAGQFACACGATETEAGLVAVQQQRLAGFVIYSCVLDEACIHNIAVHPQCQREGLGSLLLRSALAAARARGASHCYLEVRTSNMAARSLYETLGFRQTGLRKNYYGGAGLPAAGASGPDAPEDALLYARTLGES